MEVPTSSWWLCLVSDWCKDEWEKKPDPDDNKSILDEALPEGSLFGSGTLQSCETLNGFKAHQLCPLLHTSSELNTIHPSCVSNGKLTAERFKRVQNVFSIYVSRLGRTRVPCAPPWRFLSLSPLESQDGFCRCIQCICS